MKYLERRKYIEKLMELRKKHPVILISGLSGSGKTDILNQAIRVIRAEKPPVRVVQAGFSGDSLSPEQLLAEARGLGAGRSALFIDNADTVDDLPAILLEITQKYRTTIFVTGKRTSRMERTLEGIPSLEPATLRVSPFSYGEFLEFHGMAESRDALELYERNGGLPGTGIIAPDSADMSHFLSIRANSFLLTDIIEPYQIRNPGHIRKLLELIARSTGEALPARLVVDAFAAERTTISPQSVLDYLDICRESGILEAVPVFDFDRGKTLETGAAWYFADNGLRSAFLPQSAQRNAQSSGRGTGRSSAEADRATENLIYLQLADSGWRISQGRISLGRQTRETISFICEREGKKIYVQVTGNAATAGERLRKRTALLAVRDAWPKYLVDAATAENAGDGIVQTDAREFLYGCDAVKMVV